MIPKSLPLDLIPGVGFSEKIMRKQNVRRNSDSTEMDQTLRRRANAKGPGSLPGLGIFVPWLA